MTAHASRHHLGEIRDRDENGFLLWAIGGSALLVAALLLRSWNTLAVPGLHVEDTQLFSQYYGAVQPLADIVRSHFGQTYVTLIPNGFAWLYAWADVRIQPALYHWTGFLFSLTAVCCLFYSGLIRSRVVLLFGPLLLGLTAINHIYYYTTLIYVMYTGVILLLALMLTAVRMNKTAVFLLLPLLVLLPWSGPYSVLALPVGAALLLLYRMPNSNRLALLIAMVSTVVYFLTVHSNTVQLEHLTKLGIVKYYFQTLLDHVVFLGQLDRVSPWFWLATALLVAVSFLLFHHDRFFIRHSLIIFGISASSLALFYLSVKFPLFLFPNVCHRVISLFFWCFFLLYAFDRLSTLYGCGRKAEALFAALLLLVVLHDNSRYPKKRGIEIREGTQTFVAAVYEVEQLPLKAANQYVVLRLNNPHMPLFSATAIIGDRGEGARQLSSSELPPSARSPYLVEPRR